MIFLVSKWVKLTRKSGTHQSFLESSFPLCCNQPLIPPQYLYPRTRNLLMNSVFLLQGPGSKLSVFILPPKGIYFSPHKVMFLLPSGGHRRQCCQLMCCSVTWKCFNDLPDCCNFMFVDDLMTVSVIKFGTNFSCVSLILPAKTCYL